MNPLRNERRVQYLIARDRSDRIGGRGASHDAYLTPE
jgi:hypothetical protein